MKLRDAQDIYNEARDEVLESGNQGLETIAKVAIQKTQKEMFYSLYRAAEEKRDEKLISFFDELDRNILFYD